jgi:hypothetical protein
VHGPFFLIYSPGTWSAGQKILANFTENDSQRLGTQLLGFLPPGKGVLVLSPIKAGSQASPPVMAIPIAELFAKHQTNKGQKPSPENGSSK